MAEEDVDWGMDDDFDPWQPAEEQMTISRPTSRPTVRSNEGNGTTQNGDFQLGTLERMEGMMEAQQRSRRQDVHLPVGWTLRTSRHDVSKQYFYNPYTHETTWNQPGELPFDDSGIVTPPPQQPQQGAGSSLHMRISGRLTDHMKMAPIGDTSIVKPLAGASLIEPPVPAVSQTAAATPTSPKLRLIDRIQPARYVPQEKRETKSPITARETAAPILPVTSDTRPGNHAEEASDVRDIQRKADTYRPQYHEPEPPLSQTPKGESDSRNKEEVFASRRHTEKLPEWLEANDPRLGSEDSSRRRGREVNDDSPQSSAIKRVKTDHDTPSKSAAASSTGFPDDSKFATRDRYNPRTRVDADSNASNPALPSRMADNTNSRNSTPLVDRLHPRSSFGPPSAPTATANATSHHLTRSAEPSRVGTNGLRASDRRDQGIKEENRFSSFTSPVPGDRGSQAPTTAPFGSRDNRYANGPTNNHTGVPPGPRSTQPSGANTAPIIANRWSRNASPTTSDRKDSKSAAAPDQTRSTVNQNNSTHTNISDKPDRGDRSAAGVERPRIFIPDATNVSTGDMNPVSSSQSVSRKIPSQSELNVQQAYTSRPAQKTLEDRPSVHSNDRPANFTPGRPHPSDQYRPNSATRDLRNGDNRPGYVDQSMPARSSKEPMPSPLPNPGFKRTDLPYQSNPPPRAPVSSVPVRTRSPVPHLPPPSWSQSNDRRSPSRQGLGSGRRRSPSPSRIPPGATRYPAPRWDDRMPRTSDGFPPALNPRDDPRPHPRAPDLYTPGGRSPPRKPPRAPDPYESRGDPRATRFDPRGPPPTRGPLGRR